ncbi:MAG: PAS domain S-box protein [Lentisphaeria bacterium]|nr:PAS domain S-box protein [Lentisphaeria bacterium]
MSIRLKITALITFIFLGLTGSIFIVTQRQVERSFNSFELDVVNNISSMLKEAYDNELSALVRYAEEIARAGRTRTFIDDTDTADAYTGLDTAGILKQRVSFFAISNAGGDILTAREMDSQADLFVDASAAMMDFIRQDNRLRVHHHTGSVVKGVTVIQDLPFMIVSVPVLPEKEGGLIRGAVILGRAWKESEFVQLTKNNGMTLFHQRPEDRLVSDMQAFFQATNNQIGASETTLSGVNGISTYITLADIYDTPGLVVRLSRRKQAAAAAYACAVDILTVTFITGAVLFIITLAFLEVTVQQRLRKLVNEVKELKTRERLSEAEITVRGRDEIGKIAHGLRFVIDAMKTNRYRWMRAEKRLQELLEFSPMATILAKPDSHKLYRVNDAATRTLGYSKKELTGKKLDHIFQSLGDKDSVADLDHLPEDTIQKMDGVITCRDGRRLAVTARVGLIKQADDDLVLVTFMVNTATPQDGNSLP